MTTPPWLNEVVNAIEWTDGVDSYYTYQRNNETVVAIRVGTETFEFVAGDDGEAKGVAYEGGVHDMTDTANVQWWIAGQLYERLRITKTLLARWQTWATSHGHDVGMLDDTREFLKTQPNHAITND